jgi:hypothetical protein
MRVLLTGAALLLTRARLIAERRCRRGQQSYRREEHDETLHSLHRFHLLSTKRWDRDNAQEFGRFQCRAVDRP